MIVLEGRSVADALSRSNEIVKGRSLRMFWLRLTDAKRPVIPDEPAERRWQTVWPGASCGRWAR